MLIFVCQTWLIDHMLSMFVGELDTGGDDGPAEPL